MRPLNRNGAGHWAKGALVATGLGLGAVGGFLGSLVRERRDTRAARHTVDLPADGQVPAPRAVREGAVAPQSLDRPNEMRF